MHYTSPCLLRDAEDRMVDISNDCHDLMTDLLASQRSDAVTLLRKLQLSAEENEKMSEQMRKMETHMSQMGGMLKLYSQKLGIPNIG